MKYILLHVFLAILLTTRASHAVELASNNVGELLIFPFYLADNGWDTYISVQASSRFAVGDTPLSLRIVLRDGRNGETVGSFNTYSTNRDLDIRRNGEAVWRAALYMDSHGQPRLRVAEGQCLIDSAGTAHSGSGVELPLATTVGMVEIYSMAEPSRSGGDFASTDLHCEDFADKWKSEGLWNADPSEGLSDLQASAISGEAILINVTQGLSGVYAATALRNFDEQGSLVHTHPGSPHPNLADAQPGGIGAVADVLRTPVLSNDVTSLDEVDASTDWIISYPTSGYHAAKPYTVDIEGEERNCSSFGVYGQPVQLGDPVVTMNQTIAQLVLNSWSGDGVFRGDLWLPEIHYPPSPEVDVGVALCNAVTVVTFGDRSSLLLPDDSPHIDRLSDEIVDASSHLWWTPLGNLGGPGDPVLAFRLTRFVNGTLEGGSVLANYAFMSPHRRGAGAEDY